MFSGKPLVTSRSKESWIPGGRGKGGQGVSLRRRRLEIVGQGEGEASKLKPRQVSCEPRRSKNVSRGQWELLGRLAWQKGP